MEEVELEVGRGPDAERSLLHAVRGRSVVELREGFELGGQVVVSRRDHHRLCRRSLVQEGIPLLNLDHHKQLKAMPIYISIYIYSLIVAHFSSFTYCMVSHYDTNLCLLICEPLGFKVENPIWFQRQPVQMC